MTKIATNQQIVKVLHKPSVWGRGNTSLHICIAHYTLHDTYNEKAPLNVLSYWA